MRRKTGERSSRALVRDHARRTAREWHQWVAQEAEDGIVNHVNNVYHVRVAPAAAAMSVTRHIGRIEDWELRRIVDELAGADKPFYVDGRTKTPSSALLVVEPNNAKEA